MSKEMYLYVLFSMLAVDGVMKIFWLTYIIKNPFWWWLTTAIILVSTVFIQATAELRDTTNRILREKPKLAILMRTWIAIQIMSGIIHSPFRGL